MIHCLLRFAVWSNRLLTVAIFLSFLSFLHSSARSPTNSSNSSSSKSSSPPLGAHFILFDGGSRVVGAFRLDGPLSKFSFLSLRKFLKEFLNDNFQSPYKVKIGIFVINKDKFIVNKYLHSHCHPLHQLD